MLILSPHLDDAVLSCGELMSYGWKPEPLIVTVFAGEPDDRNMLTPYDKKCGFSSAGDALRARRLENMRAVYALGCDVLNLNYVDSQYGELVDTDDLYKTLAQLLKEHAREDVYLPVGINHQDHETVRNVALHVLSDQPHGKVYLYEDLPSRVHRPDLIGIAMTLLSHSGWRLVPIPTLRGDTQAKELAIRSYRSQLWELDWRSCLVPERFWEATWTG